MPFVCHAASSCCYTTDTGMQIRLRCRRRAPAGRRLLTLARVLGRREWATEAATVPRSLRPLNTSARLVRAGVQRGAVAAPTAAPPRPPTTAPPTVLPVAAPTAAPPPAPMAPPVTARWPGVSPQAVVIVKTEGYACAVTVCDRTTFASGPSEVTAPYEPLLHCSGHGSRTRKQNRTSRGSRGER